MSQKLPITLREPHFPDDFAAIAAVINAAQSDWPTSAQELERQELIRDRALFDTKVVAEQGGQIVGVGQVKHDDFSFEEWRYSSSLFVLPEARNQGVGSALYNELLARLQRRGAREIRTQSNDRPTSAAGRDFLEKRGWNISWKRFESALNTKDADLHAFDALLSKVQAAGVQIISLADLAAQTERNRWFYELDWILFQDVPLGTVLTKRTQAQWVKEELEDPHLRPELSFMAVQPGRTDPLTGPYVGYSTLGQSSAGSYYIGMTGVLRSVRGQGVAKALKVAAMRALAAQGGGVIKTFNDAPNTAMLTMNAQLGFQRTATIYRYELRLGDEQ